MHYASGPSIAPCPLHSTGPSSMYIQLVITIAIVVIFNLGFLFILVLAEPMISSLANWNTGETSQKGFCEKVELVNW